MVNTTPLRFLPTCPCLSFLPVRREYVLSRRQASRGGVLAGGRGRGATMPAWMTAAGLADKLHKKSHRKVFDTRGARSRLRAYIPSTDVLVTL